MAKKGMPVVLAGTNQQGVGMFYVETTKGRFSGRQEAYADANEFAAAILAGEFKISSYKTGDGRPVYTRQAVLTDTGVSLDTTELRVLKAPNALYEVEITELEGI